jgi:uncharacterized protein
MTMTSDRGERRLSGPGRILVALVQGYRRFLSPALPPRCRFYPSCSAYALEALQLHGALRGSWLTVRRLSKCHPFHAGGFDFVPGSQAEGAIASHGPDVEVNEPNVTDQMQGVNQ